MSIKSKIVLYISLLFFCALSNGILTFVLNSYSEEKIHWINQTHLTLETSSAFLSHMKDAETGQRGYLLTKDISYLEPYHKGVAAARTEIKRLKILVNKNIDQMETLSQLEKHMEKKLSELEKTITLTDNNRAEEALLLVKKDIGKQHMDVIRELLQNFIYKEHVKLEVRKGDYREHKAKISTVIITSISLFIFITLLSLSFIQKALFTPLKLLLDSTKEMEKGKKIEITNITPRDEMGYLLSSFYKMNHKITGKVEELDYKANHDELTGLLNRTTVLQDIERAAASSHYKSAVLYIDLNKFKELNDTHGHDTGDYVLIETAKRLKSTVRTEDRVYRIGGDEFIILLTGLPDSEAVHAVVSKILSAFHSQLEIQGRTIPLSLSIGIALAPDHSRNSEQLIKMADIAMYSSKKQKQGSFKIFDPSDIVPEKSEI